MNTLNSNEGVARDFSAIDALAESHPGAKKPSRAEIIRTIVAEWLTQREGK